MCIRDRPEPLDLAGYGVELRDGAAAIVVLGEIELFTISRPGDVTGGRFHFRREVASLAAGGTDLEYVAAGGAFIAHHASDKYDGIAVG